jgi:hypothetical protein
MKMPTYRKNEHGVALVISLVFLAILGMLGTTAYVMTSTDLKIGRNYQASAESFFDADAGVQFAMKTVETGLLAGTFSLPTNIGGTSTLSFTKPSGFNFELSPTPNVLSIEKVADNTYSLTSTGTGPNNAQTLITVRYERDAAIAFAAFGDKKMEMKNSATVYSYDSRVSAPPTSAAQSTHQGDIGSNDLLVTKNSSFIDGDGVNGEKATGDPTANSIHDTGDFYGTAPLDAGRIDPDPLGISSGGAYDPSSYSVSNNNNLATSPSNPAGGAIAGNFIGLGSSYADSTMTLHGQVSGADYYLTGIDLKNSTTLTVDTTAGPVKLFLECVPPATGTTAFKMHSGSAFDVIPAGNEHKFAFFSDCSGTMDVKHGGDFNGLFYAPNADVVIKNSGDVNGAIWGSTVDIRNGGTLCFNTALTDEYASNNLSLASWKTDHN